MRRKKVILVVVFLLACFSMESFGQNYQIRNFDAEDAFNQSYVYSIAQDKNGYLWIGTDNGLVRYDGYKFQTFTTNDSIADNFITCSYRSAKDIWFGHANGDLTLSSGGQLIKFTLPDTLKTMITDITEDNKGNIWISSYSTGLYSIKKKRETEFFPFVSDEQIIVLNFEFINDKELIVGSLDGLYLVEIINNQLQLIRKIEDIPESKITSILPLNSSGKFLIATQDKGLLTLHFNEKPIVDPVISSSDGPPPRIQSLLIDRDSGLWAGTFGSGLFRYQLNNNGLYAPDDNLAIKSEEVPENINVLFQDREGIIWFGNYGQGLSRMIKKSYAYSHNNLEITALCANDEFQWVGTPSKLYQYDLLNHQLLNTYDQSNGLPDDGITALYSSNTHLWVGTTKHGIYRLSTATHKIEKYTISSGKMENSITKITGKQDVIWIGTRKGACTVNLTNNTTRWYTINQGGLPHNIINDVFIDSENKVWITTQSNTLSNLENDSILNFRVDLENVNFILNSITQDSEGNIWVGSLGGGLFIIGDEYYTNINSYNGLMTDYCYSLIGDNKGNIWVGHIGGISRINQKSFDVVNYQRNIDINPKYKFNKNAVQIVNENNILFGFNNGLLTISAGVDNITSSAPILSMTSIKINERDVELTNKLKLPSGRYKIHFDFIGINLMNAEGTQYKYFLEGYDVFPTTTFSPKVTYNGLTSGEYVFRVNATNHEGIDSEQPISITIIIRKPFWKSPIFYIITAVIIFILGFWLNVQKQRTIDKKNKLLEELIQARTREIQSQKDEIKKQHDLINEKNKDITDSIAYASRIQHALMPDTEKVKSIFPESFIIEKPRDIVSGDFIWVSEYKGLVFFAVADCSGHGVPGAFMSILGNGLINDIVHGKGITSPEMILNILRADIIRSLHQTGDPETSFDTINMGICSIDLHAKTAYYSGALTPLVLVREGKLELIKADRYPLGISYHEHVLYKLQKIQLVKGDMLYMFSDGFQDQFGGPKNRKHSSRRLHDLLQKHSALPVSKQKFEIEWAFNKWKGNNDQTDDVLLMGIRI